MAWRGVHIDQPAKLSQRQGAMQVDRADHDAVRVPLEDIAWVVVDSAHVELTSTLLASFAETGIAVIFTDQRHLPVGALMPFHTNYSQAEVSTLQCNSPGILRRRLWRRTVRYKILNQASLLETLGLPNSRVLRSMAREVKPGDPDNVEARAARRYWPSLFDAFRRDVDSSDSANAMLNYGYAVMRAAVARSIAVAGLIPAIGIHHRSQTNPFNLADDMIEPFRPVVDQLVHQLYDADGWGAANDPDLPLSKEDRQELAGVLTHPVRVRGDEMNALNAIDRSIASLVRSFRSRRSADLELPELV